MASQSGNRDDEPHPSLRARLGRSVRPILLAAALIGLALGLCWDVAGVRAQSGPPTRAEVHTITGLHQGLRVYWYAPPSDGGSPLTGYEVQYRASGVKAWTDAGHAGLSQPAVITGLRFSTTYQVRVRALNANGAGPWSTTESRRTSPNDGRPDQPWPPTLEAGDGQLKVSWTAPAYTGGRLITGYRVRYTTDDAATWRTWAPGGNRLISGTTVTITGLDNGVSVGVVVAAVNARGQGRYSSPIAEAATLARPAKPTLAAQTAASGSVKLSWKEGSRSIIRWDYRIRQGSRDWGKWTAISGGDAATTGHTVSGLTEDARYEFQLRAANASGSSPASAPVSAVAGLTPNLSSYLIPLSHDELDTDGAATAVGSFAFLTKANDLTSRAASFIQIAAAEALLVNLQGLDGQSHASVLAAVEPYDYFNWFPYGDCFYSYYVTEVLPDPPLPARKLFRIRVSHQDSKCEHAGLSSMRLLEGERNNPALLEWRRLHGQVIGSDGIRLLQRGVAAGGHAYRLTDRTGPTSIVINVPVGMRLRAVSASQDINGHTYITYLDQSSNTYLILNPHTGDHAGPFVDRGWADYDLHGLLDISMRYASLLASIRQLPLGE